MSIQPCPFCGFDDSQWEDVEGEFLRLACPECAACGPPADSHATAAALWNRRA
ncbi:Lar family restriction alleviation protein [Geoalkalibacter halelectricus]|uniref:Lar family restriction alleviation protein n=1 Tax=Geoalkalibacter halelectricus TaxID=2847045 RepID=UPI003D20BD2F